MGSINLSEYVKRALTEEAELDFEQLKDDIREVTVYMNEVLDEGIPFLPLKGQRESSKKFRNIGIGVMGLGDMLIKMGVKYGSTDALVLTDKLMSVIANAALEQSALLAKEEGSYPAYDETVLESEYLKTVAEPEVMELIKQYGLRNAELLSIAPTGSISTMLGVSGGVEPIFQISYTRKSESLGDGDVYYKIYTQIVKDFMEKNNITDEKDLPDYFVTAMTLNYKDRINMQSVMQKYVDSAISSTVNLPEYTTVEEIEEIYLYAWEKGLKGITVYRDGCERSGILITTKEKKEDKSRVDRIDELQDELAQLAAEELAENPNKCPMCGGELIHTNNCESCLDCGYSPCSI